MSSGTVLLADSDFPDTDLERALIEADGLRLVEPAPGGSGSLPEMGRDAVGLLVQWTRVGADLLAGLPKLRAVGRFGVGVDSIDVEAATRRAVAVVHSGDYATEEVALHAVALALALLRRVRLGDAAVRSGQWTGSGYHRGIQRASRLRAGVVGLGRIGCRVGQHLSALGLPVAGYDPMPGQCPIARVGSLDELLANSDLISLHLPLTAGTHGLIDARRISLLPAGALLVNTARGGLVDEVALAERLAHGELGGAALDVFADEPVAPGHPLTGLANVVLSPHVGYFSEQAMAEARTRTVTNLLAAIRGEQPRDIANPQWRRADHEH
jgi:phosphoglycerate dehydrogenase-like enzyme